MKSSFFTIIAVGASALLSSCVDPYYSDTHTHTHTTVTHHRPGYVVTTLPRGHRTEVIGGTRYYSHNNVYYRPQGSRYVVVEAPNRGARSARYDLDRRGRYDRGPRDQVTVIRTLPRGYRTVNHRGVRYYESNGVYYRSSGGGYVIVPRPR